MNHEWGPLRRQLPRKKPRPRLKDTAFDETWGRAVAAFHVQHFDPRSGERLGLQLDEDTGLESYTEFLVVRDDADPVRLKIRHLPRPEKFDMLVAVKSSSPEATAEWEYHQAAAAQRILTVEGRYFPSESLLLLFCAKQAAKAITANTARAGMLSVVPVSFDLRKLRDDPDKQNVFQAWTKGRGRITTHAFFGFDVLEDEAVSREEVQSVRVAHRIGGEEVVLSISDDGRIWAAGGDFSNDDLEGFFRRMSRYLVGGRPATLPVS